MVSVLRAPAGAVDRARALALASSKSLETSQYRWSNLRSVFEMNCLIKAMWWSDVPETAAMPALSTKRHREVECVNQK